MKRTKLTLSLMLALGLSITGAHAQLLPTDAQLPDFTYQGKLERNGTPAHGNFDIEFSLWDAATGGTRVAGPDLINDVPVVRGVFSVPLVFPDAFAGEQRYLQVIINGTTLPRQPVSTTPVAQWALNGMEGPVGPQGDIGPAGPQGDVGPAGPQGEMGATGSQGEAGVAGPQGDIGPAGPQGDVGPAGPQGEMGATGSQGEAGVAGPQGDIGPVGPQGDVGPAGQQGEVGPAGPPGATLFSNYGTETVAEAVELMGGNSASWQPLGAGPAVTVTPTTGHVLVILTASITNPWDNSTCSMGFSTSGVGATVLAPSTHHSLTSSAFSAAHLMRASATYILSGLNNVPTTFVAQYRTLENNQRCDFADRILVVVPF